MIRVNGWTDYIERIGNKIYNVSEESYGTYKIECLNVDTREVQARHVGYIEQVEKIFEEERKRAGITVPCIVKTVTRNGSKC